MSVTLKAIADGVSDVMRSKGLASGTYIVRMVAASGSESIKVLVR